MYTYVEHCTHRFLHSEINKLHEILMSSLSVITNLVRSYQTYGVELWFWYQKNRHKMTWATWAWASSFPRKINKIINKNRSCRESSKSSPPKTPKKGSNNGGRPSSTPRWKTWYIHTSNLGLPNVFLWYRRPWCKSIPKDSSPGRPLDWRWRCCCFRSDSTRSETTSKLGNCWMRLVKGLKIACSEQRSAFTRWCSGRPSKDLI